MADGTQLSTNIGTGDKAATQRGSYSGESMVVQVVGNVISSGGEGAWTFADLLGGAGAVAAGVQRITLASDDPGVVLLTTIDSDTSAIKTSVELLDNAVSGAGYNITQFGGAAVPIGAGVEATALRVTLATDSTGTLTVDTTGTSGLEVVQATAADLNMTEASASAIKTAVELLDNAVSGAGYNITQFGGAAVPIGAGVEATALRVTVATDSTGVLTVDNGGTFAVQVDDVGSVVDANNSTTTPLGGDAVFTGTGTDMLGYSAVCVTLTADVDSATDGMCFQFSTDNSNWDDQYAFTLDFSASDTRRFQFPVCARYFRVLYTNGSGGQSVFRVQTILHTANQLTSIHRLADDMSPDRSAQVVKSVLYAQAAGSGNFTAVDATAGGNLKMSLQEISDGLDIGAGNAGSETQRVSISTDDVNLSAIKTAIELIDTVGGGTEAAAQRVTIANDSTGLLSVDDNGGSLTIDQPAVATGGASFFKSIDLDESEEEVKATAATFYGGVVINLKATPLYLKVYNATAANVTVGTTVPDLTFPIPSQGDTNGAGFNIPVPACGIQFGTALTVACTTGIADNDSGAPGANECVVSLFYE